MQLKSLSVMLYYSVMMRETAAVRWMIMWLFVLAASVAVCIAPFAPASAAINSQINFQGKLTNPDGTNVTNGSYSIVFSIYSVASAGTALWTETQNPVTISDGIFQVSLGSVNTALATAVDFNTSPLYLGIKVGADTEMTPRVLFTASPYALNSDKLGGISSTGFVQLSPGAQQTGNINIGGTINGNTFNNSSLLFGGGSAASIQSAASQSLQLDSGTSGTVSLGSTNATSITLGKASTMINVPGSMDIDSGVTVPTVDQVVIDNTASTGVITAGVNSLNVRYKGGAAAVEGSGMRIDYTPGTTSGGTWNGLRIVAGATGPVTGVTAYGIKLEGPTTPGAGTEVGIRVASGWDIGVDVQSGGLQLAAQSDPASPAAGNLRIYAKDIAGRVMPKWIGPAGVDTPFQASLGFNRVAMASPNTTANCSTGFTVLSTAITGAGTCTVPALASTSLLNSVQRVRYATAAGAGSLAYHRQGASLVWRGNATGLGGFFYTTRFGSATLVANNRTFVGLSDSIGNPTNVDPLTSAVIGKIGMAMSANTGNWRIVNNAAGTAPTTADLGALFPVNVTSLYELVLYSAPNGASIGWRVTNVSTGDQTSGTFGANIPTNTTFLSPIAWITNNTTASAAAFDYTGWYLESDN
jgi:hypothetical protein